MLSMPALSPWQTVIYVPKAMAGESKRFIKKDATPQKVIEAVRHRWSLSPEQVLWDNLRLAQNDPKLLLAVRIKEQRAVELRRRCKYNQSYKRMVKLINEAYRDRIPRSQTTRCLNLL